MQISITCIKDMSEKMRKYPLFFVRKYHNSENEYAGLEWKSVDRDLEINFSAKSFGTIRSNYCLCIVDGIQIYYDAEGNPSQDRAVMFIHDVSINNENDCINVLNCCISRSSDNGDKYAFVELLWLLDKQDFRLDRLSNVINQYDKRTIPIILNILRRICRCLSLKKQKIIESLFHIFDERYDIYMPEFLAEAFRMFNVHADVEILNLFQIVDTILSQECSENQLESNNALLQLNSWLHSDEERLVDYDMLISLFPLVSWRYQLQIVKRYFHDVRMGNTTFRPDLIAQFKDNRFGALIRYRCAIMIPTEQIPLTIPLLCDSILTLYHSGGKAFQTFDGVLDFAMIHCDKTHPDIKINLERFLPTCEGGTIYNKGKFKGFVDWQLVQKMNESTLTDSSLLSCIRELLGKHGMKQEYYVCKYDGTKIEEEQLAKCMRWSKGVDGSSVCYERRQYENKWIVSIYREETIQILNSFLKEEVSQSDVNENFQNNKVRVELSMISLEKFRNYILSLPSNFERASENNFIIPSYRRSNQSYKLYLVEKFSDIIGMRIIPRKDVIVGSGDVFGFWKEETKTWMPEQYGNKNSQEYQAAIERCRKRESEELNSRVVESLKKEIGTNDFNGSYFEVPYDGDTLRRIVKKYYFNWPLEIGDDISRCEFLVSAKATTFKPCCSPTLSETTISAIDLPFFWCRGRECFHNSLEKQTLSETKDWRDYSMYHMIEIIGYPKIHATAAGNEPDDIIRNFIAVVNKAMQKFRRLKCRSCGHLMFARPDSGFNRYNYFSCVNPNCSEVNKTVYLNYCYKCKKGLIDSRDTKQCPNGWYICPTCLSCCDDSQYERQAQRYMLLNRPVPYRIQKMLGHGHNDKGMYFCPICGNIVDKSENEHGEKFMFCTFCHNKFSDN